MKKFLIKSFKVLCFLYVLVCILLFFFQEKLIFFPEKLDEKYPFSFSGRFEEINTRLEDGVLLNGLLFHADSSKGLIFYLHGNAGSLKSWGSVSSIYNAIGYDVFMPDYRGYGKSQGSISSEEQVFNDIQQVYEQMKKRYPENRIIILGYSIGTGPAAKLASANNSRLLILQAPYYNLSDMMRHTFPFVPTFLLKYKFQNDVHLKNCSMPVIIYHGNADEVIYYGSSLKLKEHFKPTDTLITLPGQGHNNIHNNPEYKKSIVYFLQ